MRKPLALLVVLALALPAVTVAGDYRDPGVVNRFLTDFHTPQLAPGESGRLTLTLSNPDPASNMTDVLLTIEIYQYLTVNERLPVSEVDEPPFFRGSGDRKAVFDFSDIPPGGSVSVELTVVTAEDTSHGDYFSQAAYVVRTMLNFSSGGADYTYRSRGFFRQDEWDSLFDDTDLGPRLNETKLFAMGVDGIIPDTSFGVRKDIPRPCLYGLYVGIAVFLVAGYGFYVWENPSAFPWLYRRLAAAKGALSANRTRRGKKEGK